MKKIIFNITFVIVLVLAVPTYACLNHVCGPLCGMHHGVNSRFNHADFCLLPKQKGSCRHPSKRFHFNVDSQMCEEFLYGGCAGNGNNFETKNDCEIKCM